MKKRINSSIEAYEKILEKTMEHSFDDLSETILHCIMDLNNLLKINKIKYSHVLIAFKVFMQKPNATIGELYHNLNATLDYFEGECYQSITAEYSRLLKRKKLLKKKQREVHHRGESNIVAFPLCK